MLHTFARLFEWRNQEETPAFSEEPQTAQSTMEKMMN